MSAIARVALLILMAICLLGGATAQTVSPPPAATEATQPELVGPLSAAPAPPQAQIGPDASADPRSADSATLPRDLSPWGMFANADRVVQAVMVGLAFASVVTWTVLIAKGLEIAGARLSARAALRHLDQARSLDEAASALSQRRGAAAWLVAAALQETSLSADLVESGRVDGIKERIAHRLARIEGAAGRRLARGTGVLASIGATAPFVGLFGTVWGIMNAFIGISEAETTNLAVVAPGIAEALLATAAGLVAAIPAVVVYNIFARSIGSYRASFGDASAAVLRLASRDLDRGLVLRPLRAAAE